MTIQRDQQNKLAGPATLVTAAVMALAVFVVCSGGCGQRQTITKLEKEPQVTVMIDPVTGSTRTMPIEEYVKGVVGGEMGRLPTEGGEEADWPENAYAAQAILARTFTMEFLSTHEDQTISTNVEESQAYKPENITPAISRAVDKTRGLVLVADGKYLRTWFHSYSGGRTATAQEGLNFQGEAAHTKSVTLPANEFVPEERANWQAEFTFDEIAAALKEKGVDVGQIQDLRVTGRGPSGRVTEITVVGSGGERTIHGADFRLALGAEKMQSTLLHEDGFRAENGRLFLAGKGFGHGVGLSQWDAYKMAKEGRTPEEIVLAFYRNAAIEKAWD
ncbi:MAG TPA: SpoIID/LytB domain-containing protein [Firmicutes bacterium]|nr:SpoIID/LytB domain-containing protein [Bacillota bacterium]